MRLTRLKSVNTCVRPRAKVNTIADVAGADKTKDGKASAFYKFSAVCTRALIKTITAYQARKCVMDLSWDLDARPCAHVCHVVCQRVPGRVPRRAAGTAPAAARGGEV